MIKMQVIGVIGQDATINNVNSKTVVNFSVAHSEKYKDQNGQTVNKTVWVAVSYWVDRTTIAQYLKKSTNVYLEGVPSVDVYKNKDGQTVPQIKLRAIVVQLLGGNKQDNPQAQVAAQPTSGLTPSQEEFLSDEAPF
jgi:single-strand DNA-binding protein